MTLTPTLITKWGENAILQKNFIFPEFQKNQGDYESRAKTFKKYVSAFLKVYDEK